MTRSFLDQPRVSADTDNFFPDDTIDTVPFPVINIADGYRTGLKLTEAVEALANEAEEIGIPHDTDGALQIGDINGDHIVIEQDVIDANGNKPRSVINTIDVVTRDAFFRFRSEVRSNGGLVEFQINEETAGVSQHAEFSGKSGSELPAEAVQPTLHFAETMMQVADALCREKQIGGVAREGVIDYLATPDITHQDPTRVMGSTALGKLLTNLGLYRAA